MEKVSNREAINRVRGSFKLQSTDTYVNITDRFILSELLNTSLKLIKQTTDKRKLWNSPNIFKPIPCLKLEQVLLTTCSNYSGTATIAKSIVRLPKIAEGTNFGMLIQGLYSIDTISRRFIESTPDRFVNSLKLGLRNNQIHFWIEDNYLYIGDDKIEKVKISAYFEEDMPDSLIPYPSYCGSQVSKGCCDSSTQTTSINDASLCCPPNPYDEYFPCPGYMISDVLDIVCEKLLKTYKRSLNDDSINGKDDTK